MRIICSKFDCYIDYIKCKDCQHKVRATDTFVSCYHALDADNIKFNVAVFKEGYIPQKEEIETKQQIESVRPFNFEVYNKVILTQI